MCTSTSFSEPLIKLKLMHNAPQLRERNGLMLSGRNDDRSGSSHEEDREQKHVSARNYLRRKRVTRFERRDRPRSTDRSTHGQGANSESHIKSHGVLTEQQKSDATTEMRHL